MAQKIDKDHTDAKHSLKLIQLSDIHFLDDPTETLGGMNTHDSLQAVLADIQKKHLMPDQVLLTGDLAQNGGKASYQRLAQTMSAFSCPIYCIPGNHDDHDEMKKFLIGKNLYRQHYFSWENWRIILMDSTAPGLDDGFFAESDFAYMENQLSSADYQHALLVMHHQPIAIQTPYIDEIRLINEALFWEKIRRFPQIKAIIFGHVHQVFESVYRGIQIMSAPSTCTQFLPKNNKFAIDATLTPGYRWLELKKDGSILTKIYRI